MTFHGWRVTYVRIPPMPSLRTHSRHRHLREIEGGAWTEAALVGSFKGIMDGGVASSEQVEEGGAWTVWYGLLRAGRVMKAADLPHWSRCGSAVLLSHGDGDAVFLSSGDHGTKSLPWWQRHWCRVGRRAEDGEFQGFLELSLKWTKPANSLVGNGSKSSIQFSGCQTGRSLEINLIRAILRSQI